MHSLRSSIRRYKRGIWRVAVTSALMAGTTIAYGASATAASLPRPASVLHRPGGGGTIAAKTGSHEPAVIKHAAARGPAAATGDLSTITSVVVNGGYTSAGIGMRNLGYGTISITGVPAGATVQSATLLWDIVADQPDPTFAQGTVNGMPITGTEWASGATPCWPPGGNFSYEADVTSLVTGNGSYALAGFATGESDGADPWNVGSVPPLLEGATLVVIYQLTSMPSAVIQIAEGATETDSGNSATATMNGFTASATPSVTTTYIVADGQEAGNTATFNGTTLANVSFPGAAPQAVPGYSMGNLWDNVTTDVSSLVSPGDTSATLAVTGDGDCLVWAGQVLSVKAPYTFILPQSLYSSSAWQTVLSAPHHDYPAIDIPAPVGTPYFAVTDGTVTYTSAKACGLGIVLQGNDGVRYTYCHGSSRLAASGAKVTAGTELGLTGNTGHTTGPHLHFQITYPISPKALRCPQTLLLSLYNNTYPPPDAQTVQTLPTTGCVSKK